MAIIGVMSSVIMVSLSNSKKEKSIEVAARQVAAALREAQNYALSGKGASSGCNGYTFFWTGSSYGLKGYGTCPNINETRYNLENRVIFANSGSFELYFPHANLSIGGPISIDLKIETSGPVYKVCVYQSGRVEEINSASCP